MTKNKIRLKEKSKSFKPSGFFHFTNKTDSAPMLIFHQQRIVYTQINKSGKKKGKKQRESTTETKTKTNNNRGMGMCCVSVCSARSARPSESYVCV